MQTHNSNRSSNGANRIRDQNRHGRHGKCPGNNPSNFTEKNFRIRDKLAQKQCDRAAEFNSLRQKLATVGQPEGEMSPTYICDEAMILSLSSSGVPMWIIAPFAICVCCSLIGSAGAQPTDDSPETCRLSNDSAVVGPQSLNHQGKLASELLGPLNHVEMQKRIDEPAIRQQTSRESTTRKKVRNNAILASEKAMLTKQPEQQKQNSVEHSELNLKANAMNEKHSLNLIDFEQEISNRFTVQKSPEMQEDDATLTNAIILIGEIHENKREINRILPSFFNPGDHLLVEANTEDISKNIDAYHYGLTEFGEGGCFGIDHPSARVQLEAAWTEASEITQGAIAFVNSLNPELVPPKPELVQSKTGVWVATRPQMDQWFEHLKKFHSDVSTQKLLLSDEKKNEGSEWLGQVLNAKKKFGSTFQTTLKQRDQEMEKQIIEHADLIKEKQPGHNVIAIIGLEHVETVKKSLLKSGRKVLVLSQKS